MYRQADWKAFSEDCPNLSNTFHLMFKGIKVAANDTGMWLALKEAIAIGIKTHIPQRTVNVKNKYLWIREDLKKLIKRHYRLYKKKSQHKTVTETYKD